MDRIDRDHFLDFSTKSKNFILPKHIQLLRCGSPGRVNLSTCRPRPKHLPAIRWSVAYPRRGGHGSMVRRLGPDPEGWSCCFGDGTRTVRLCIVGGCSSGGDEETRTPDPLLAKEMLYQLSYVPAPSPGRMVGDSGLEPETSALSGQRSNQLS